MQDVHNLCWKLAAVLDGKADDSLLDTYEAERRPTDGRNIQRSLENSVAHVEIGKTFGLSPEFGEEANWKQLAACSAISLKMPPTEPPRCARSVV